MRHFTKQHYGSLSYKKGGLLKLNNNKTDFSITAISILLLSFLSSFVAGSFIIHPQSSKAITGLSLVDATTLTLTTSSANVDLVIVPTSGGTLASGSHNLIAGTNVPTGYSLSLFANNENAAPSLPNIMPATGTLISPTTLQNNTWGFAINQVANSTAENTIQNGFDPDYAVPTPNTTSKWANPTISTAIKNTTRAAKNDTTTVYYGAKANMSLVSGTYTSTVAYTAVTNISMIPVPSVASITPATGTTAGGTAIEIVGKGFTVDDESVTTSVTLDGQDCAGVSISTNTPTTGQDTIYCNTPAHAAGAVDVVVTTWSGTATIANGYTYIEPANVIFVSPNIASTILGTETSPVFTIVGSGFAGTTDVTIGGEACGYFIVVSDTHIFCHAPKTITTTGDKAIIVTKFDTTSIGMVNVAYKDTDYPTFQSSSAYADCSTTEQIFRDERDSQLYYVKRMPDNKCWMVDNLKYANFGTLSQIDGRYLTVDGTDVNSAQNSDVAKYVDPGATNYCTGNTNMPINTNTRCGLLYNWYAATNGTGTYSQNTKGNNVAGSICPANFRLPSAMSDGNTSTGDGDSFEAADFAVLNTSMNAGMLVAGNTENYLAGWQPSGAWGGVFSGNWYAGFDQQDMLGRFWSSTVYSATNVLQASFGSEGVMPGNAAVDRRHGLAVRCVMEALPTPPAGTNLPNISSTNPAVLDVYPTTGWEGDVVAITSNALFTNVANVTIGGTACEEWGVVSTSLITCRLPAKTSGSINDIAVTNNNVDVTPASTYTHMKVTYFDPSSSKVGIGGKNYNFYANGFTSANCSAMTASNAAIGSTPAAALAYVRDTRNKQTYKVKKMADGKCWMVDNLKYIDAAIVNTADNTTGMTYNNGDHLNNGGTTAFNTIDETTAQSTTNSDKAFFNNPMRSSYCYGTANMPNNTLTHCGYLYNWYAATNGTGTYSQNTQGVNVTGNICPANFRLPSATSGFLYPTTDGTGYKSADFPVLNTSMGAGSLTTGATTATLQAGWQPSGAWGGVFVGRWTSGLVDQGSGGNFWSSTNFSAVYATFSRFNSSEVNPGNIANFSHSGYAVRCVLD